MQADLDAGQAGRRRVVASHFDQSGGHVTGPARVDLSVKRPYKAPICGLKGAARDIRLGTAFDRNHMKLKLFLLTQ